MPTWKCYDAKICGFQLGRRHANPSCFNRSSPAERASVPSTGMTSEVSAQRLIDLYSENAIAIESEAKQTIWW